MMRRELKAELAKEQFDHAMAKFQGECPVIKKDKPGGKTNGGAVAYYYAPLDSIVQQTKDLIQKNGFSYAIQTQTKENNVKVTCIVKHESGHSESSDVEVPLGTKTQVMSASQVVASALTFAKRYAFCNAFGILTGDDDDDAAPVISKAPSDKQKIAHLCKLLGLDSKDPNTKLKIQEITKLEVTESNYKEIINRLEITVKEANQTK